jgi:SAM-dependent methyltransferase
MDLKSFYNNIDNIIYNISYSDEEKIIKWNLLKKKINESKFHPEKFNRILKILNQNNLNKKNIRILDHGSGGCYTIIYLYALGYENVFGVDVDGSYIEINNFFFIDEWKKSKKKNII